MNLGVFLAIGESIQDFKDKGQDELLLRYNLKTYSKEFTKVYVFSYQNESYIFHKNIIVLPNKYNLQRYLYCLLLPLFYLREINSCCVFRGLQITGGLPGLLTKLIFRKKVIINYGYDYSKVAWLEGKKIRSVLYLLFGKLFLHTFDAVIVTTPKLKNSIKQYTHKIKYIPNGIDPKVFKSYPKVLKKYTCMFVGRLEKQKNLYVLINAISQLKKKSQRNALFIGNGPLKQELIAFSYKKQVQVKFLDKVPHNLLPKYYNQCQMFVLPSLIEGNPKVLLEAMSCGMTVIGNQVEGIASIIKHNRNGLLFNNNTERLRKQIDYTRNHKYFRSHLGREARKLIISRYNYNKLKLEEIKLLKSLSR